MPLKITDIGSGNRLRADDSFVCIKPGCLCEVFDSSDGLFVKCEEGDHFLSGQTAPDGALVGFEKVA
jgi:hypothetical protein